MYNILYNYVDTIYNILYIYIAIKFHYINYYILNRIFYHLLLTASLKFLNAKMVDVYP